MKKIISFMLVVTLVLSISVPALASSYTAGSQEEFYSCWLEATMNSADTNTIILTADINVDPQVSSSDKTYIITSENGSTITGLSAAAGTIEINKCNVKGELNVCRGDVTLEDDCEVDADSITMNGLSSITLKGTADLGDVIVSENSVLTVETNAAAQDIKIVDNSSMTVAGNLVIDGELLEMPTGMQKGMIYVQEDSQLTVNGDVDTTIISAFDGADVTIDGNLTTDAPDSYRNANGDSISPSITVADHSTLTVKGETEGVASVFTESELSVGKLVGDYSDYALLLCENFSDDHSSVRAGSIISTTGKALFASGCSSVIVTGDIEGVSHDVRAFDCSSVVIYGKADKIESYDKAIVTVYGQEANGSTDDLNPRIYHNPIGGTLNDDLANMCIEYIPGSVLEKQRSEMTDAFLVIRDQFLDEISDSQELADAIGIAAVNRDELYAAEIGEDEYSFELSDAINNDSAKLGNKSSDDALKDCTDLNPYLISASCGTLALALDDADNDPTLMNSLKKALKTDKKTLKNVNSILKAAKRTAKNAQDMPDMSEDERLLEATFKALDEAVDAVGKSSELGIKYTEFSKLLSKLAAKAKTAGKTVKWSEAAAALAKYRFGDYADELALLETVIKTQPLTPEAYVAGLAIRHAYMEKVYGAMDKLCDADGEDVTGAAVEEALATVPQSVLIDVAKELKDTVFGSDDQVDAKITACALTEIFPTAIDAYEAAILNVKNGDTGNEAVMNVQLSYAYAKAGLEELCRSMITLSDKEADKAEFQQKLDLLENMKIGEPIGKIK